MDVPDDADHRESEPQTMSDHDSDVDSSPETVTTTTKEKLDHRRFLAQNGERIELKPLNMFTIFVFLFMLKYFIFKDDLWLGVIATTMFIVFAFLRYFDRW